MGKNTDPRKKTKAELDALKTGFLSAPADLNTDAVKESKPFETIPTMVPNKPPFLKGTIVWGTYRGTKRIYSDKFSNPKIDGQGRTYRDMHLMENEAGDKVGIFSVGSLGAALPRLEKGTFLGIRYDGIAEKPIKRGQQPPHEFTFLGKDSAIEVDWNREPQIDMVDAKTGESALDADDGEDTEDMEG